MSAGNIPYTMRLNKSVDRNIFFDVISRINRVVTISDYQYISLGGPFLEDFKNIHSFLGINKLISLEKSEWVIQRQEYNKTISSIELKPETTEEFISSYIAESNSIFWLDYAIARERKNQLYEFETLLRKLVEYDIVKITLNSSAWTLHRGHGYGKKRFELGLKNFKQEVGAYFDESIDYNFFESNEGFSKALCLCIRKCLQAVKKTNPDTVFHVLNSYHYNDSSPMLTLTGILLPDDEEIIEDFYDKTKLKQDVVIYAENWTTPKSIDMPFLSVKERLQADSYLPDSDWEELRDAIGYQLDEDEDSSNRLFENYATYYRHYPYFSKILP